MGHRHFPNSLNVFGVNQSHDHNNQPEQSYHPMGRFVASENGSFVSPLHNMPGVGVHHDPQWNSEGRENEYASSSFSREGQTVPPAHLVHSYHPYSHSAAASNLHTQPERYASHPHASYYNRNIHNVEGVIQDSLTEPVRGSFKRKGREDLSFSGSFERGSTSRSYGAGSSSGSSHPLLEKPTSDYRGISLGPIGLHQHRGSGLPMEDSMRNVRSRSRLNAEPNTMRGHFSSYPSQLYHSTTFPTNPSGTVNLASLNSDLTTQDWNHGPFSAAPGRAPIGVNGSTNGLSQFVAGGSAVNAVGGQHDSASSGHPVSSSQYFNGNSAQGARESRSVHSRRTISTTYRTSLSYSHAEHDAVTSDGQHLRSEGSTYRNSRPLSAGGLHNSYRNGRPRLSIERLQAFSGAADAHERMDTEASMIMDHSSFYNGSRSSFDQYTDMRLDVDSMSYEELLALGETIGSVSTGLSEDMLSKCLMEKVYHSGDLTLKEGHCAICLEEYKNEDGIGTLKNCGHDYHVDCIRKWLSVKNVCPICKAAAFT